MTVAELIEQLKFQPQDAEVRLAVQPSYPFEHRIARVEQSSAEGEEAFAEGPDANGYMPDDIRYDPEFLGYDDAKVVYIVEGGQIGYLPEGAVTF